MFSHFCIESDRMCNEPKPELPRKISVTDTADFIDNRCLWEKGLKVDPHIKISATYFRTTVGGGGELLNTGFIAVGFILPCQ